MSMVVKTLRAMLVGALLAAMLPRCMKNDSSEGAAVQAALYQQFVSMEYMACSPHTTPPDAPLSDATFDVRAHFPVVVSDAPGFVDLTSGYYAVSADSVMVSIGLRELGATISLAENASVYPSLEWKLVGEGPSRISLGVQIEPLASATTLTVSEMVGRVLVDDIDAGGCGQLQEQGNVVTVSCDRHTNPELDRMTGVQSYTFFASYYSGGMRYRDCL